MNPYQACEQAYKNGYNDGLAAAQPYDLEIAARVKVAYEILATCHTTICRQHPITAQLESARSKIQSSLDNLLEAQVDLGILKREEDLT